MSLRRCSLLLLLPVFLLVSCARPVAPDPVDREIENLRAFAKLYGYVRWFHPSREAVQADWNAFAVEGVAAVRGARDAMELRKALHAHFAAVSDGIELFTAEPPPLVPVAQCDDDYAWQHLGFGDVSMYRRAIARRNGEVDPDTLPYVELSRELPIAELRGRRLRVRVVAEAHAVGNAGIDIRVRFHEQERPHHANQPIRGPASEREFTAEIPPGAASVTLAIWIARQGTATVGDIHVEVEGEGGWNALPLDNLDFHAGTESWNTVTLGASTVEVSDGDRHAVLNARPRIGPRLYEAFPAPGETYTARLGPSLWARVPLTTCDMPGAPPVAARSTVVDTDEARVAAVIVAWNIFQHFYPYFDVVDVDWEQTLGKALRGMRDVDSNDAADRVLLEIIAGLDDGHAQYLHPRMAAKAAPPMYVNLVEHEVIVVASDTDAVRIGDRVLSVDSEPAQAHFDRGMSMTSGSPQWQRHVAGTQWFGAGEPDSSAVLQIERDGEVDEVTVLRSARMFRTLGLPRPQPIAEVEQGIWYIDLGRVSYGDFRAHAETLAASHGVVLDLRGYTRDYRGTYLAHFTDGPLHSPQFDIPQTSRPDSPGSAFHAGDWHLEPAEPEINVPTAMLISGSTMSAAETVASLAAFHGLADLVGAPTAGANGNVTGTWLPNGGWVQFTGLRVRNQDDTVFHAIGVQPDMPVEPTIAGVRAGRDEVLERALEVIRAQR